MPQRPDEDPLGAAPMLPAPSAEAVKRATDLFARLVRVQRDGPPADPGAPVDPTDGPDEPTVSPPTATEAPRTFGGGRRYDLALAYMDAVVSSFGGTFEEDAVFDEFNPSPGLGVLDPVVPRKFDDPEIDAPLARPPAGAPVVRPSVGRGSIIEPVSDEERQELVEKTASGVQVVEGPDGATSFEIDFRDDVFDDLTARITLREGRVFAAFVAPDRNVARLLESEAGRLRANLEARGLRVEEVRVVAADES